jgi:long-chain acyl-CoA synthetase
VQVPEESAHQLFTLGQLIDAVRPGAAPAAGGATPAAPPVTDESWAVLLRDLPPASDPVLGSILESRPIFEPLLFAIGRAIPRVMARVEVNGIEKLPASGAFLVCPNHQSYIDPFLVCGVLPYRTLVRAFFVGATEYFETPLMAWVARTVHCVPVDPDANLVPAMKAGAFGLTHGRVLILFPEGERSIDGSVKRFKKGAPILSRHLGVPIVPVAIKGAHEVWPRGGAFNWRGMLPWRRSRVRLTFGEPMQFGDGETYAAAAARLRAAVEAMWQRP